MTKHAALTLAHDQWAAGLLYGYGVARLRRKSVKDRCEIGYWHEGKTYIKGRGPTWEAAFKNAGVEL